MRRVIIAVAAITVLFAVQSPANAELPAGSKLAVAAFSQPVSNWQLLAGYIPKDAGQAGPQVLAELDKVLETVLKEAGRRGFIGAGETGRCEELVLSKLSGSTVSPLKYWKDVGECTGADNLLVPMLFDWREREGGDFSVREPARVVLDLYLIDVAKGVVADRYHHEETQRSLSENLLDLDKFIKRGAQWVTARELAREAMQEGVEEFGR